ncbi:Glycosyl transferase family 2 [Pseudobutyrivibrio sp. OR37]|uniref:glycosyltransferase n=1 Tax=Pseudobutyrivibrio sp. OR37 TaxID=1798186 RepID=UPI0008E3DAF3|nr:glycosyltransferase [Pseudobutyrivibrio sp. OR37]SFI08365.1 Glycosyl transferase family 2 [Pseudobutyrivibrio sp. OR37]
MKLSVLVPIYNVEKYLDQCLKSLHLQTLKDMEILCINDGSTDGSKSIIEKYVKLDERFRLIDKYNTGYGNTMNVGLDEANGEYIGIVESDDYIDSDMFEKLLTIAEESGADVVKSNFYYYSDFDESSIIEELVNELPLNKNVNPIKEQKAFLLMQTIWSALYKADFLKSNNVRFHETPGASFQDVSFVFQVFANANNVFFTDKAYYHYRITNPNSSVKMENKLDKLCGEIDHCNGRLASQGNQQILEPILSRLSFRIFIENYYLAVPAYQFVMLNELARRLRIYESRGDFSADIWDDEAVATAKEIIADKDAFYKKTGKKIFDNRLWQGTMNASVYKDAILTKAASYKNIVLYGAGVVGSKVKDDLVNIGVQKSQLVFAVTSRSDNQDEKDGIPVKQIDEFKDCGENTIFIITVKEENQYEMLQNLQRLAIDNVLFLSDAIRYSL